MLHGTRARSKTASGGRPHEASNACFSGQMEADGLVPTECSASYWVERPSGAEGDGTRDEASARRLAPDGHFSVRLSRHSLTVEPREVEFSVFKQATAVERMQHRKPTTAEAFRARTDR